MRVGWFWSSRNNRDNQERGNSTKPGLSALGYAESAIGLLYLFIGF